MANPKRPKADSGDSAGMGWTPPQWFKDAIDQIGPPPTTGTVALGFHEGVPTWTDALPPQPEPSAGGPMHLFSDGQLAKWSNVGTEGQIATAAANGQSVYANP